MDTDPAVRNRMAPLERNDGESRDHPAAKPPVRRIGLYEQEETGPDPPHGSHRRTDGHLQQKMAEAVSGKIMHEEDPAFHALIYGFKRL